MSRTHTTIRQQGAAGTGSAEGGRKRSGVRLCHFHGNPNSYNAALSFAEAGELIRFHTSIYDPLGTGRRAHPELPKSYVSTHPMWEVLRLASRTIPFRRWNGESQGFVDLVSRRFDSSTARTLRESDRAVYCYEDSAATTFERATQLGIRRIYELPIMHYRQMQSVFEPEIDRHPELRQFFQSCHEPQWKLDLKDEELQRAEVIVVPTTMVRKSIEQFLPVQARFVLAPYGADASAEVKEWTASELQAPLQIIFVGGLGPRKGLHILFEALTSIPAHLYRLTLVGRWEQGFREWLTQRYPIAYDWTGPLTSGEVHAAYRRSQVLIFPSLAEGYALVIPEAMASGIPVITTERTAGVDLIQHGVEGWLVPAGNCNALREQIEQVLANRASLPEVGAAARRVTEWLSWEHYREVLRQGVAAALGA